MAAMGEVVEKLCQASRTQYGNPYEAIAWPEMIGPDDWCMSPELVSLHGTDAFAHLTEREQKRLAFFEAVNFFSLNIHGEKPLVEGLARRLYRGEAEALSPYLHHFLDEENKHMIYFAGFCLRYAGKIYPDKKLAFPREYAPGEEDFLFFAKVLLFEEIVDVYNVRMSQDERLAPVARQINLLHHRDEARHLVFGRELVKQLFAQFASAWSVATVASVREYLANYLVATWKEYYNPEVYRDAGLDAPYELQQEAFQHPRSRSRREEISRVAVHYLREHGILTEEPAV